LAHSNHADSLRAETGSVRAKAYPGLTAPSEGSLIVEILTYDRGPVMIAVPRSEWRDAAPIRSAS
jgi:hypothetical protein